MDSASLWRYFVVSRLAYIGCGRSGSLRWANATVAQAAGYRAGGLPTAHLSLPYLHSPEALLAIRVAEARRRAAAA